MTMRTRKVGLAAALAAIVGASATMLARPAAATPTPTPAAAADACGNKICWLPLRCDFAPGANCSFSSDGSSCTNTECNQT